MSTKILELPQNYSLMNEEEMVYIDGGAVSVGQCAGIIDLSLLFITGAYSAVMKFGSGYCKWFLKRNLPKWIPKIASAIGLVNTTLGTVSQIATAVDKAFSWASIGGVIANVIDLVDNNEGSGYVFD